MHGFLKEFLVHFAHRESRTRAPVARQAEAAGGSDDDDPERDYFRRDSEQIGRPHAVAVFGKDSGAEGRLRADLGKVSPYLLQR